MAEEKTITELVNDLYEIDNRIYTNKMRLKSIESNFERVAPYSAGFECLMNNALRIKEELEGKLVYCIVDIWLNIYSYYSRFMLK